MADEEPPPTTPFWLRSDSNNNAYFRRSSSLGGRAAAVATQVFFLATAAFLLFFFIIPPFVSTASQIFRPHLVRRSWDYLNFVLVLFAIICGFLSRSSDNNENRNDRSITSSYEHGYSKYSRWSSFDRCRMSTAVTPRHWYDDRGGDRYSDQIVYNRFGRLRSSSSYPDLRLREPDEDERWRFYDDTRLYGYRIDGPDRVYESYSSWREARPAENEDRSPGGGGDGGEGGGHDDGKKVEVDAAVAEPQELDDSIKQPPQSSPPSAPPSPPPAPSSPPPSKPARRRKKRVNRDAAPKAERRQRADPVAEASEPPPPPPPQAPPPPPLPIEDTKSKKNEKKRGGTTKDFLIALRRKKKKQRQKSVDGLELLFGSDPQSADSRPPQSPPPPPPPPPPPFLHGLFSSKKGKSKRSHSTPPPPAHERRLESLASTVDTRRAPLDSRASKPNPPAKETAFTGKESPLLPIPSPPPPPPFKMPVWKFVVQGDYVRMASDISSWSESQDLDDSEDPERVQSDDGETPAGTDGDSPAARRFCPSPDVDTKADNFIARFRAGLRLEKMNSVNMRRGRSNLGPDPGSEPGSAAETHPRAQLCTVQDGASGQ